MTVFYYIFVKIKYQNEKNFIQYFTCFIDYL